MPLPPKIKKIFSAKDVEHGIDLFSEKEIKKIEASVIQKNNVFNIMCLIRKKYVVAKPEEVVRQLWIKRLIDDLHYPEERINLEVGVTLFSGAAGGFVDIAVYRDDLTTPYIYLETKRPRRSDGIRQLKDYCDLHGVPIAVWSNGNELIKMHREDPNFYQDIPRIPDVSEKLESVLKERHNFKWLTENDKLKEGTTSLHKLILDLKESVLANMGDDLFDNIFKLLYAKLYDESKGKKSASYELEFFKGDRDPDEVLEAVNNLFDKAKTKWPNIFEISERVDWPAPVVSECVSYLESIRLFDSNLRIIDEAFENLIPQQLIDEGGQFFTPRPIQTMTASMLNPKPDEYLVDIACGSAGFLLHSVRYVGGNPIDSTLPDVAVEFAEENIYGLDFSKSAVKISKCINLIIGDGKSHMYYVQSSLDPKNWDSEAKIGMKDRLTSFLPDTAAHKRNQSTFRYFDFDVLMTNPPFGGAIKDPSVIAQYELGKKDGKVSKKISRHILFINRALEFLKPGGRMAIVVPQGILTNANTDYIRRFFINNGRILAIVGLHGYTFRTATSTKTSVLFLQKYTKEEREQVQAVIAKFEGQLEKYLKGLKSKFSNINWKTKIADINSDVPKELKKFCKNYFEENNEDEDSDESLETINDDEKIKDLEKEISKLVSLLKTEEKKLTDLTNALKQKSSNDAKKINEDIKKIKKNIPLIKKELNKKEKEISKYTLAGQIFLALNNKTVNQAFRQFWLDRKIILEIDYPIFFATNKKPLKDNKGNYVYKRNSDRELILAQDNLPIIDHDLDEIAKDFIKFAQKQNFDFMR